MVARGGLNSYIDDSKVKIITKFKEWNVLCDRKMVTKNRNCLIGSILVNIGQILKLLEATCSLYREKDVLNLGHHRFFVSGEKVVTLMDVKYGSQGCLMEQRQLRLLFYRSRILGIIPQFLASSSLLGPFIVWLVLYEDWNNNKTKNWPRCLCMGTRGFGPNKM